MDHARFDAMTRALEGRFGRRGALRLLAGAALGAVTGAPASDASAGPKASGGAKKRRPKGKRRDKRSGQCECRRTRCRGGMEFDPRSCRCKCPRGMRECRDGCVGRDQCCPGDPPCPEDPKGCCHAPGLDVCTIDGCCRELNGMKACNDFCVDTASNPNHCGGCNVACGSGTRCVGGVCRREGCSNCAAGEECCNGACALPGPAICTRDGWCSATSGQACCAGPDCSDAPCCSYAAGEACCVSSIGSGGFTTTCCPGGADQCAPGGCCPAGTTWTSDLGCDACCPDGNVGCNGCVAPTRGR